jgi:hypothetical protein
MTEQKLREEQTVKNRVTEKLLRNEVIRGHTMPVDAVADRYVASHNVGRARRLIEDEMVPQAEAGIVKVGGGARGTVTIDDVGAAVDYLEEHDGNVPFNIRQMD